MKRIVTISVILCAMLVLAASVPAATLVWEDNFNGAAGADIDTSQPNGWQGWSGAKLSGNGTGLFNNGSTEWSRVTKPVNQPHIYEIAYRFPDYTDDASFGDKIAGVDQPFIVRPSGNHNGLRFEVYRGTSNHHRLQWFAGGTSDRESQFPLNAYYKGNLATDWQVARFVIGPQLQAIYVNGTLVHFTRYNLADRTELLNWAPKGGGPTARLEVDYVRVYEDSPAPAVRENVMLFDGFDQSGPKTPGDGMRNNEENWGDENAQKPNGLGQAVLNSGSTNNWRHDDGGRPFSLAYPIGDEKSTLEVWLRCPQGTDLNEDNYVGLRGDGGQRWELYFRGGSFRPFVHDGTAETVGTKDIRTYFVGDPTVDFQRVDIVFSATTQEFWVNEQLVETFNVPMNATAHVWPWIKGNGPAKTLELDSLTMFNDVQVPVELSTFSVE